MTPQSTFFEVSKDKQTNVSGWVKAHFSVSATQIRKSIISGYLAHPKVERKNRNESALASAAQHSLNVQRDWYFLLREKESSGIARELRNAYLKMKRTQYKVQDILYNVSGEDESMSDCSRRKRMNVTD